MTYRYEKLKNLIIQNPSCCPYHICLQSERGTGGFGSTGRD